MKIFITSQPQEAINFAKQCIATHQEGIDVFFNKSTFLQTGLTYTSDRKLAESKGIPVWQAEHIGGSIVCFDGDLSLCITHNQANDFGERMMAAIKDYFIQQQLNVTTDNNDILVDNKKVASWARGNLINGQVQTVAHFSVNINLDLIKKICTKPMEKVPGQLSDYNITAEDLWKVIETKVV